MIDHNVKQSRLTARFYGAGTPMHVMMCKACGTASSWIIWAIDQKIRQGADVTTDTEIETEPDSQTCWMTAKLGFCPMCGAKWSGNEE